MKKMTFTTFTGLTETMADRLAKDLLACVLYVLFLHLQTTSSNSTGNQPRKSSGDEKRHYQMTRPHIWRDEIENEEQMKEKHFQPHPQESVEI